MSSCGEYAEDTSWYTDMNSTSDYMNTAFIEFADDEVKSFLKPKVKVNCYFCSLQFKQSWILYCEKRHCDSVEYTIYIFTHSCRQPGQAFY